MAVPQKVSRSVAVKIHKPEKAETMLIYIRGDSLT
jgi:hypothetical protein